MAGILYVLHYSWLQSHPHGCWTRNGRQRLTRSGGSSLGLLPRILSNCSFTFHHGSTLHLPSWQKCSQLRYCAIATESEAVCCEKAQTSGPNTLQSSARTWCPDFEDGEFAGEEGNKEWNKERDTEKVRSNLVIMTNLGPNTLHLAKFLVSFLSCKFLVSNWENWKWTTFRSSISI